MHRAATVHRTPGVHRTPCLHRAYSSNVFTIAWAARSR